MASPRRPAVEVFATASLLLLMILFAVSSRQKRVSSTNTNRLLHVIAPKPPKGAQSMDFKRWGSSVRSESSRKKCKNSWRATRGSVCVSNRAWKRIVVKSNLAWDRRHFTARKLAETEPADAKSTLPIVKGTKLEMSFGVDEDPDSSSAQVRKYFGTTWVPTLTW